MSPRPIIFISAASKELKSARQLVANTLTFLGYEPEWQDIFGTEQGDLRGMLRRRVDGSQGVVQLVGHCYGAEPPAADPAFGRVSYTQYEALYARQRGKKIWYLFIDDRFPADPHAPEPEELRALQAAYRARVKADGHLRHSLTDARDVENTVLKLRDDLGHLRRGVQRWAALVLGLLVLLTGAVVWVILSGGNTHDQLAESQKQLAAMREEMAGLRRGVLDFAAAKTRVQLEAGPQSEAGADERTYAALGQKLGIDPKVLREKLPALAEQIRKSPGASPFERASAAYVGRDFAEAERLSLEVAHAAETAQPARVPDALAGYELAGRAALARLHYPDALRFFRSAAALSDRQRDPLRWAGLQWSIAYLLDATGKYSDAESVYREALAEYSRAEGPDGADVLSLRSNVASALKAQGKTAEAEPIIRDVLATQERVLGPEHPHTLSSRMSLANVMDLRGRHLEAEAEHRAILAIKERVLGPEDPDTLISRTNLANALHNQGRDAEAEQEYRAVLPIQSRVLGPEFPDTLLTRMNLANALLAQGRSADAEMEYRAVLPIQERILGPQHPDTLSSRMNLAVALGAQGRHAEAEEAYRTVLNLRESVLGPDHPDVFLTCYNLAGTLFREGKKEEALAFARRAEEGWRKAFGSDHEFTQRAAARRQAIEAAQ